MNEVKEIIQDILDNYDTPGVVNDTWVVSALKLAMVKIEELENESPI